MNSPTPPAPCKLGSTDRALVLDVAKMVDDIHTKHIRRRQHPGVDESVPTLDDVKLALGFMDAKTFERRRRRALERQTKSDAMGATLSNFCEGCRDALTDLMVTWNFWDFLEAIEGLVETMNTKLYELDPRDAGYYKIDTSKWKLVLERKQNDSKS